MGNERQKVTNNSQIVEMSILLLQCIVFFYILNLVYKNSFSAWWPLSDG